MFRAFCYAGCRAKGSFFSHRYQGRGGSRVQGFYADIGRDSIGERAVSSICVAPWRGSNLMGMWMGLDGHVSRAPFACPSITLGTLISCPALPPLSNDLERCLQTNLNESCFISNDLNCVLSVLFYGIRRSAIMCATKIIHKRASMSLSSL